MVYGNLANAVVQHRLSALNVRNCEKPNCRRSKLQRASESRNLGVDDDDIEHTDIEYKADECAITNARLSEAHKKLDIPGCADGSCLSNEEKQRLGLEQRHIRKTLNLPSCHNTTKDEDDIKKHVVTKTVGKVGHVIKDTVQDGLARLHIVQEEEGEEEGEEEDKQEGKHRGRRGSVAVYSLPETMTKQPQDNTKVATTTTQGVPTPQDIKSTTPVKPRPQDDVMSSNDMIGSTTVKVQLMAAKFRSRLDQSNDGVLGVQKSDDYCLPQQRMNSLRGDSKFMLYNKRMSTRALSIAKGTSTISLFNKQKTTLDNDTNKDESKEDMDVEDISYVRKPNLARIIEQYEALSNHPKYSLKQVVLSRRFHLYAHRFGNAQYQHTLVHPSLKQPSELYSCPWLMERSEMTCMECKEEDKLISEKYRSRKNGHRFIIAADSQFGILMDGMRYV